MSAHVRVPTSSQMLIFSQLLQFWKVYYFTFMMMPILCWYSTYKAWYDII